MPDVAIVGGGVIGAACALELASRGASVTLVERDHLAAHASGRNHGLWLLPDDDVNVAMARASLDAYRRVASDAAIDIGLDDDPVGTVLAATNARDVHAAEASIARAARHGIAVDDISGPRDIRDREPGLTRNLAGAWLVHSGYRLDPEPSRWRWRRPPRRAVPRSAPTCTPAGSLVTARRSGAS